MISVLQTCQPRPEILAGTFNPEVFTASLSPIIDFYRTGRSSIDNIYTNAQQFFDEATYPTQGLKTTLTEVFSRIAGDMTVPAIHRLETAFGGGKTHTLIACTHIAYQGKKLEGSIGEILDPNLLPAPGSVSVVGVAGDEIPVHKSKGKDLIPYTLWGEIAYQIGGESLYKEVEEEATSYAAPGRTYFDKVFGGRKVLLMLDELAQYAARLEAARPDGANQLAAFLMTLHGYVRNHPGIAIVLTLASSTDAFAKQTERLAELIAVVRGEEITEDDAVGISEKAIKDITSVVARDAVQVTPVQATEISSVLAKRLFVSVNRLAARETAEEYMAMYRRNSNLLPEEAASERFRDRMVANYPFHPTLVDFLNKKLAEAENFQGTRGVLRVLSLAVRSLWKKQIDVPMIHTCHLDLRTERVVNEVLGRTGSSDLLLVLNADIGSVDTESLDGGLSNAERADRNNPHPEGHPLFEYTWKTVFLHSLVGRDEGISSKIFGITESEALFSVSFPGMTPPQVRIALEEITESAYYLRFEQGKYYASDEPTINSILARIRNGVTHSQVKGLLEDMARRIIKADKSGLFHVEHDVSQPDHLPDEKGKPILGIVSPTVETIDIEAMVTMKGSNQPRMQQNLIFLLVPETVKIGETNPSLELLPGQGAKSEDVRHRLEAIARQVLAMQDLIKKPQNFGVNPKRLEESGFSNRKAEREHALMTAVADIYTSLYYPSTAGHIVRKEIKTTGGESGASFIELIRAALIEAGELLTEQNNNRSDLINLSKLFFERGDTVTVEELKHSFACIRSWPVLANEGILEQLIRGGVQKGVWCVFRMDSSDQSRPDEFYHEKNDVPMGVNLMSASYALITPQGAKRRGWFDERKVDPEVLKQHIYEVVNKEGSVSVQQIEEIVQQNVGEVTRKELDDTVVSLLKASKLYACQNKGDTWNKSDLISGSKAFQYVPLSQDVLVTKAKAKENGWIDDDRSNRIHIQGDEALEKVLPLLRRMGSLYNKGGKTKVDFLDLYFRMPAGGALRIQLEDASPQTIKSLGEWFEVLDGIVKNGEQTEVELDVADPAEDCPFVKELDKK
ncbi:ATP-binding protein [Thermoactinomyces daqus]|uniref:ATP-binding protein n=1 Tax=Thermoactinomyces daqus TaxID=1329516 RepID=A0A7W1XD33_9BACL|nr:DUF499 domain-containing protein [Thermoactinomyces daqus]MBA4544391.1 ATP-binding protein [Thermoactinomyces daqus]